MPICLISALLVLLVAEPAGAQEKPAPAKKGRGAARKKPVKPASEPKAGKAPGGAAKTSPEASGTAKTGPRGVKEGGGVAEGEGKGEGKSEGKSEGEGGGGGEGGGEDDLDLEAPTKVEPTGAKAETRPADTRPRYALPQLLELAMRHYPGVDAARRAVEVMQQKAHQARWAWAPQGKIRGYAAPSSTVRCLYPVPDANGNLQYHPDGRLITKEDTTRCLITDTYDLGTFKWDSVILKLEGELGMPLYTFDKIGSARRAARAGVALRLSQLDAARDTLTRDVTKAFYGLKLAREIIYTIDEGREHLVKAIQKVEEDLDEGEGESTVTDLFRLRTASLEVDSRYLEARKLEAIANTSLALLTGLWGRPFTLDSDILEVRPGSPLPPEKYVALARTNRPDVRSLSAAVQAAGAAVDVEKAKFYPNVLLVGGVSGTYAPGVDRTENAFYNNPYNTVGASFGLALDWTFDPVQQYGRYREAWSQRREAEAKTREAHLGIELEVRKTVIELQDAYARMAIATKGEKAARSWLVAVSQNIAAGLSEVNELTDALVAFYQARLRYLQAVYEINTGWGELQRVVGASGETLGLRGGK